MTILNCDYFSDENRFPLIRVSSLADLQLKQDPIMIKRPFGFLYDDPSPFKCCVCCRGGGKTFAVLDWLVRTMIFAPPRTEAVFFAPTYRQAKATACPIIDRWKEFLGKRLVFNKSDLTYTIFGEDGDWRIIRLLTYENPETKRGLHPFIVVCDEVATMPPDMFNMIILPYLGNHIDEGTARIVFIGTPQGTKNLLYEKFIEGRSSNKSGWKSWILPGSTSGLLSAQTLEIYRQNMSLAEYMQEIECDFNANVLVGSVYGEVMDRYTVHNISDAFDYNPKLPVYTAWDFGHTHSTCIWFYQKEGDRITFIDYLEDSGHDLSYYVERVLKKPYDYCTHYLPHDADHNNIRNPLTIRQQLKERGLGDCLVIPNTSVKVGIAEATTALKACRFNKEKCAEGLIRLKSVRYKVSNKGLIDRLTVRQDENTDGADAFRYACLSFRYCRSTKTVGTMDSRGSSYGNYNPFDNIF